MQINVLTANYFIIFVFWVVQEPLNLVIINYLFEVLDVFSTLKHLKVILESLEVQQFTRSQSRDSKVWNPKKAQASGKWLWDHQKTKLAPAQFQS